MAKKKDRSFPKEVFVTINNRGEEDEYLSATRTKEDAYDCGDAEKEHVYVAVYELKGTGKIKRTITTDWEGLDGGN